MSALKAPDPGAERAGDGDASRGGGGAASRGGLQPQLPRGGDTTQLYNRSAQTVQRDEIERVRF